MNYKMALISLLIGFAIAGSWYRQRSVWQSTLSTVELIQEQPTTQLEQPVANDSAKTTVKPEQPVAEDKIKTKVIRQLPFATQAPASIWDAWHEEMCEEASMVLWWRYWQQDNRATLPVEEMEQYLQEVAKWERDNLGTDVSTTIAQVKQTLEQYYQIPASQLTLVTVNSEADLQVAVNEGVVIAPFAGKMLNNPHFKNGGPRYHMAVITGFDGSNFITHEVGTRHGSNYKYSGEVLLNALHDFIPEDSGDIMLGEKIILVGKRLP